jgi:AcrR family transcriptional regulator
MYDGGMVSRVESAAATRRALLSSAAELLDRGGPEAVTLREVAARAGVSRGAPYGHFADKDSLLTAVATQAWDRLGDEIAALGSSADLSPSEKLRGALTALVTVGREQPHLYRQMFATPTCDPAEATRAAGRAQDEFLAIVTTLVGPDEAHRYGAILFTGVNGIIGAELSGHLTPERWHTTAADLIDTLVTMTPDKTRHT